MAATDDRKADRENFKSATRKKIELEIAAIMKEAGPWKDSSHKDHMRDIDRIYNLYKKACAAK